MSRKFPQIPFERYADDIIVHCKSEKQARWLIITIEKRLAQCELELHPGKTKIAYCKDCDRTGDYPNLSDLISWALLFAHVGQCSRNGVNTLLAFFPQRAIKAAKSLRDQMRSWRLHRQSDKSLLDLSLMFNPIIRGWITYYGSYYKSALYPLFDHLNRAPETLFPLGNTRDCVVVRDVQLIG